ncbi:MAG: helix-turn-helix transcriptional regulator [Candidatus Aegiribacteria sp.]|nr:helix-turn-helix transcriptional regulator [Candidatus Aegiribacteria sp.]
MPGRARRGYGAQGGCRRRIGRFLEPCLLLLLHAGESHGYELLENLDRFGFSGNPADSSTIYRILRSLEEREFVTSMWSESDSGPARRVYTLTEEGNLYLDTWVKDLEETDRILHSFFSEYHNHMEIHHAIDGETGKRKE